MHPSTKWYWANHTKARKKDNERLKKLYHKDPKKYRARQSKWIKNNRPQYLFLLWRHALKRKFGVTVKEYMQYLTSQGGRCAICRNKPKKERFCVDHCHRTKQIRGLLCRKCNLGLGLFDDDVTRILNAHLYLKGRNGAKTN